MMQNKVNQILENLNESIKLKESADRFTYSFSNFEKYTDNDGKTHIDLLRGNDINSNEVTPWQSKSINGNRWEVYNTISGRSTQVTANDDKEVAKAILDFAGMY